MYMKSSVNLAGNGTARLESQFFNHCTPLAQLYRVFFFGKKKTNAGRSAK